MAEIYNDNNNTVVSGTTGDDAINNSGSNVSISAGEGNDSISQSSVENITINAGKGDDTILTYSYSNQSGIVYQYANGDGNDTIEGFNSNDTIQITSGTYSTTTSDDAVIIKVGSGSITLNNASTTKIKILNPNGTIDTLNTHIADAISNSTADTVITGSDLYDNIRNSASNVTINSGKGNDSISNVGLNLLSNVIINSGDGDDYISNYGYGRNNANVTIDAGNGNDYIRNGIGSSTSDDTSINGGAGNDTIYNSGERVTINAGNGDDIISLESYAVNSVIEYTNGDGNDTIYGFNSDDTLKITGGTYSTTKSGNDLILSASSGKITLKDSADKQLHINNDTLNPNGALFIYNQNNDTILSGSDNGDSIYSFNQSNVTLNAGKGNDHIENYGSNILDNANDGDDYIYIKSGDHVTVNAGAGNDTISNSASVAAIIGDNGNDSIRNDSSNVTINGGAGSDYIVNSGSNIYSSDGDYYDAMTNVTINGGDGSDEIINSGSNVYVSGGTGDDHIINFLHVIGPITLSGSNTTINGGTGNDTLSGGKNADVFLYAEGDGNDIINNYSSDDTIKISGSSYSTQTSGNDVIISVGSGSMTLKDATGTTLNIVTVASGSSTQSGGSDKDSNYTINNSKTSVTLSSDFEGTFDLANYASTIKTVNASLTSGGVEIVGNSKANKLIGGLGSDTLNGGANKDTLTGGDSADVFVYTSGKDVITDYEEGVDRVVISDGCVSASSVKGSDVVLKVGKGTLTLKKAKDKEITVTDELGEHTRVYGNDMFITDSDKAKIKAKSKIITIDATARTTAINITGSSKANTILGGSGKNTINGGSGNDYLVGGDDNDKLLGGAGADTLIGSAGNDTLTGGASKDVFIYESGNDIITDYKASQKDEIVLTNGTLGPVSVKGSNVIFTIGDGQLTVKGGKSQTITITDADGNKTSQKYTKSSLYEEHNFVEDDYWFAEDDNFATSNSELSDLTSTPLTKTVLSDYTNFDITKAVNESIFLNTQDIKIYADKDN